MDERLLVKRAKRGDTAAFAELYGTIYKRLLWSMAGAMAAWK